MQICLNRLILYLTISILCCVELSAQSHCYVSDIVIAGNKTTQEKIILRELGIQKGDSVAIHRLPYLIRVSKENLENLSLFNYVQIDYTPVNGCADTIAVSIHVEERWYVWPLLSIRLEDRNTSSIWVKDFDMTRTSLEFGTQIYNMFGQNHTITSGIQFGFQQTVDFHYKNITLDRVHKHFLSTGITLQRSRRMDVMTIDDAPLKVVSSDRRFLQQGVHGYVNYTYRHDVRRTHNLLFSYQYKKMADTVLIVNPDYWGDSHRERVDFCLQYFFRTDQRDYITFPLKGYFLKTGGTFYATHDFSVRYVQLLINTQYYWQLGKRWFVAERFTAGVSAKNTKAYILDRALGYGENVLRGYEYRHVIDGQNFATFNSTLRYNIIPKTVFTIEWLSALSKFNKIHFALYAHSFLDMGIAHHRYPGPTNHLSNQFLYSGGLGLDFVTYYNVVFTLSYTLNRQRERGFYVAFKLPFE